MSLKKYEAFVKIVDLGSLTRAATALGYTQSGVSHMISALEEEFGFVLLRRSRAGIRLTSDGERVFPAMRNIVNANEQLRQIVSRVCGLDAGLVRIGSFSSVAVHWLPSMLSSFQKDHPNIEFKLLNGDYHDVEHWLSEGTVDLGFITLPTKLNVSYQTLLEDQLLAVLPQEHPLATAHSFPISSVKDEPFISLLESSDHDTRRVLDPLGIRPNVKFATKDDYAIIAMVEQGLGMSILPELLLKGNPFSTVRTIPLDPPAMRPIALAFAGDAQLSPAVSAFAQHIVSWLADWTCSNHT